MNLTDLATAVLFALLTWVLAALVIAILLGRIIRTADRLELRAESLETAVRALPRQAGDISVRGVIDPGGSQPPPANHTPPPTASARGRRRAP